METNSTMNHKILHKLEKMIHTSPQLLRNPTQLKFAIQGTFDIELEDVSYSHIGELVDRIDDKVLDNYFRHHWHGEMKKYKYSGLALIDEINSLKPRKVLDIGCGYHEFKGKIDNIVGIQRGNFNYHWPKNCAVCLADYQHQTAVRTKFRLAAYLRAVRPRP